jgi:hypothetical protein
VNTLFATSLYNWLLFLHITAAMIWVGGLVTLTVLAGHTLRGGQTDAITRFARSSGGASFLRRSKSPVTPRRSPGRVSSSLPRP